MMRESITPGLRFGRWTVLEDQLKTQRGEVKWRCRCSCGTERYVLERSLRHGGSLSCGCLRREAAEQALAYDLAGESFGELTVVGRAENQRKNGGIWWTCRCSCGEYADVPSTVLVTGKKTNCGGSQHKKNYYYSDISGRRFGRLTAIHPTRQRVGKGGVVWHCRCDCGTELDVSYNNLMYTNQCSCGCKKKEHDQRLGQLQTRVDGTSLDIIRSSKIPTDNTTGFRGVYFIKGKYVAKIVFRKKAYYLGSYETKEEAARARAEAEDTLFLSTVEYHSRWQQRAASDPQWAQDNPMQIFVSKDGSDLRITFLPQLEGTRA